ncbi:MAG: ribosomal L7Ae/L30e/S12e/Gadd45 family protein [Nitrososphaerota archaeon]|nr:ribosomal L7Ae/L30e/S12e/Gadd45 family protein [Nitrososphaerota archaeon]
MAEKRDLEKQLKLAAKTGKFIVGRREVLSGLKGSKLLVWSASANIPQQILDDCRAQSVPAVKFEGNPVELGKACGIPFRVSVIAVKSPGDADLGSFSNARDYVSSQTVALQPKVEKAVEEEAPKKEAVQKKAPKKPRKKTTEAAEAPAESVKEVKEEKPKTRKRSAAKKSREEESS